MLAAALALSSQPRKVEQVAALTGIGTRTLSSTLGQLRDEGLIVNGSLALGPRWGYVLAVAVGGETCRAGLVDANGQVCCAEELDAMPLQRREPPDRLLARITEVVRRVDESARRQKILGPRGIALLGFATTWPSPLRGDPKRPVGTTMSLAWQERHKSSDLVTAVGQALGLPLDRGHAVNDAYAHGIAVAHDLSAAHVASLGEAALSDRPADFESTAWPIAITVHLGSVISAATMLHAPDRQARLGFTDSILVGGGRHIAGEIAHLRVEPSLVDELNHRGSYTSELALIDPTRACTCPEQGHLQALASKEAFLDRMERSEVSRHQIDDVLERGAEPSILVAAALNDVGRMVGNALAAPVKLLDPSHLVLTGRMAVPDLQRGASLELDGSNHQLHRGAGVQVMIRGDDTDRWLGVRGAALTVFRRHVYRRFADFAQTGGPPADLTINVRGA